MENIGIFVGIGVAVAMAAYFRRGGQALTTGRRIQQGIVVMVVAGVAAGLVAFGASYLRARLGAPTSGDVDRAVQTAREMPLIRLVFQENPSLEPKLRAAMEEQLKNPGRQPPPSVAFGAQLRQQYVLPALRNADDDVAIKAAAGMETLARYLQTTNVPLCREFGLDGLRDPTKLNAEQTALLKTALAAQEDAYRNGKTASPKPVVKDEQLGKLLVEASYTERDLQQLNDFEKLPAAEGCAATVKLYSAPRTLPPRSGGALARWLLTIAQ